jgi:hypothetical protein
MWSTGGLNVWSTIQESDTEMVMALIMRRGDQLFLHHGQDTLSIHGINLNSREPVQYWSKSYIITLEFLCANGSCASRSGTR